MEAVAQNADAGPAGSRVFLRKHKPFTSLPIKEELTVFHGVLLDHVPGIDTSWKEARPHTGGIRSDFKRF